MKTSLMVILVLLLFLFHAAALAAPRKAGGHSPTSARLDEKVHAQVRQPSSTAGSAGRSVNETQYVHAEVKVKPHKMHRY